MNDRRAIFSDMPTRPILVADGPDEDEVDDESAGYRAFAIARGVRPFVPMLELRFANGNAKAFEYSFLEQADFNPSQGIRLKFSNALVTIRGTNLSPLFAGIVRHQARWIREASPNEDFLLPAAATIVSAINVE